jgi:hypothetical protein
LAVVVVVEEVESDGSARPLVARSALGLTEFLTPFQFVCLAALATNSLNYLKYYSALAIHI